MEIFYRLFLPPDFMKKEVNESVVFAMLKAVKNLQVSRRGIPPEPDFIADGEGIEVTFAAGREASRDFIRQTCDGRFDPGAGKAGEIGRIKSALCRKDVYKRQGICWRARLSRASVRREPKRIRWESSPRPPWRI